MILFLDKLLIISVESYILCGQSSIMAQPNSAMRGANLIDGPKEDVATNRARLLTSIDKHKVSSQALRDDLQKYPDQKLENEAVQELLAGIEAVLESCADFMLKSLADYVAEIAESEIEHVLKLDSAIAVADQVQTELDAALGRIAELEAQVSLNRS